MSWSEAKYRQWSEDVQDRKDITEVVPENFNLDGCCSSSGYSSFESRVVAHLINNGWAMISPFATADGDSFGPLVRLAKFKSPSGVITEISHG